MCICNNNILQICMIGQIHSQGMAKSSCWLNLHSLMLDTIPKSNITQCKDKSELGTKLFFLPSMRQLIIQNPNWRQLSIFSNWKMTFWMCFFMKIVIRLFYLQLIDKQIFKRLFITWVQNILKHSQFKNDAT